MLNKSVAFIGLGGCGTNVVLGFERLGYTAIHINSSKQDESSLVGAKTIKHLKGYDGAAGLRAIGETALAKNVEIVDEIINLKEQIIFVVFGGGGGTGSGIAPCLCEMLTEETDKIICAIEVLPGKTEDYDFHVNAYQAAKELSEIRKLGATMFLDNNANGGNRQKINELCVAMLHSFLSNDSVSALGNVDSEERKRILSANGNLVVNVLNEDKSSTEKVVEILSTNNNIYAPIERNTCEYIGIINAKNKIIDKSEITKIFGEPRRTFTGYDSNQTIIVASGLNYPITYLNELKELAKEKHNARLLTIKANKNILDDIDFGEVEEVKEVIEEPKKLSRREMLEQLRS